MADRNEKKAKKQPSQEEILNANRVFSEQIKLLMQREGMSQQSQSISIRILNQEIQKRQNHLIT